MSSSAVETPRMTIWVPRSPSDSGGRWALAPRSAGPPVDALHESAVEHPHYALMRRLSGSYNARIET